MMVPGIVSGRSMDGSQPTATASSHAFAEVPHQVGALLVGQFMRQGDHDLGDNAPVFTVGLLLLVQPLPGGTTP
ncbi:hypothetical protein ABDK74_15815 [Gluconobacter sp. OJB]